MSNLCIFLLFAKFGALAFGGGYVVIPLLYETFVENHTLLSSADFGNLMSVSQVTPGPTSENVATYIGFSQNGLLGAILATLGFVFPSFIITGSMLYVIKKYQQHWMISGFMRGTRLMALAMLIFAIPLFFNISVVSCPWPMHDIIQSVWQMRLIMPENLTFNLIEFMVFVVCCGLLKIGFSATKLLIWSLLVGYGMSFL